MESIGQFVGKRITGRAVASVLIVLWSCLAIPLTAESRPQKAPEYLARGFTPISFVSKQTVDQYIIPDQEKKAYLAHFCQTLEKQFKRWSWDQDPCGSVNWQMDVRTEGKYPLIYATFGEGKETTLLLGGVHPDELTPIPIAFRFARHLSKDPTVIKKNSRVVVAPLVNPDGFIRNIPSRTNGNGVDLNRNFLTIDWYERAKDLWQKRERNPRHFPGYFPNTEIETLFQIHLIDEFKPDKILSIHAPLGFLDYDGPGDTKPVLISQTEKKAKQLVHSISEKSQNYRVVDYRFFPGSLGNYAGNERIIPTITLELETTNPDMVDGYWEQFLPGLLQSIHYPFTSPETSATGNATKFSADYLKKILSKKS